MSELEDLRAQVAAAEEPMRMLLELGCDGEGFSEEPISGAMYSAQHEIKTLRAQVAELTEKVHGGLDDAVSALRVGISRDLGVPIDKQSSSPVDLVLAYSSALKDREREAAETEAALERVREAAERLERCVTVGADAFSRTAAKEVREALDATTPEHRGEALRARDRATFKAGFVACHWSWVEAYPLHGRSQLQGTRGAVEQAADETFDRIAKPEPDEES